MSEVPAEVQPAKAVHKNKIYAIILAVAIALAVVIIAVIAGSIYIAYRIWLKKELENDAKMAKSNQGKKR